MSEKKTSIWTKDFILVCLASLATNITMRMLDANLASYAGATWDSMTIGGQLTSFFNIGSICMAFVAGRLVDLRGRRNSLMIFCILFAIPTVAMALIPLPGVALTARLIQGVAKGVVTVAAAAIVSDITPRQRMSEGMAMFNIGNTISFAIGPMLGLNLVEHFGYKAMFLVCAVVYALGALLAAPIRYENKEVRQKEIAQASKKTCGNAYKGIWRLIEKNALIAAALNMLYFAGYSCILVFLTVYSQTVLQLSAGEISLFYIVAAVVMMAVRLLTAKSADKHGAVPLLVFGHVVMITGLLFLAFAAKQSYIGFLAAGACYGAGVAVVSPTLNAVAVVDSPKDRTGAANAAFYFLMDFGPLFGSAVFGRLVDAASTPAQGYQTTFLISCGIEVVSMLLCVLTLNNKARAARKERSHIA